MSSPIDDAIKDGRMTRVDTGFKAGDVTYYLFHTPLYETGLKMMTDEKVVTEVSTRHREHIALLDVMGADVRVLHNDVGFREAGPVWTCYVFTNNSEVQREQV